MNSKDGEVYEATIDLMRDHIVNGVKKRSHREIKFLSK